MKAKTYDVHLFALNLSEMYPSNFTLQQGEIFKNRLYILEKISYISFSHKMRSSLLLRNIKI